MCVSDALQSNMTQNNHAEYLTMTHNKRNLQENSLLKVKYRNTNMHTFTQVGPKTVWPRPLQQSFATETMGLYVHRNH